MARLPYRLNKVRIVIQKLDQNMTVCDPDFREPIGLKDFQESIVVYGQVNFYSKGKYGYRKVSRTLTGDVEDVAGRLTFDRRELVEQGVIINIGDKIVSVGPVGLEIPVDGKVVTVNPYAFRRGINLLVSVEFTHNYDEKESIKKT